MYIHPSVRAVQRLHGDHLHYAYSTVEAQLSTLVDDLVTHQLDHILAVSTYLGNGHPDYTGQATHNIPFGEVQRADFEHAIARTVGFRNWREVREESRSFHPAFEQAVDCLVKGELKELDDLLTQSPDLLRMHSPYGHRAELVHYLALNGIEIWRQQIPDHLVESAKVLLKHGADPERPHHIYGGQSSLYNLITSSTHIRAAGIQEELCQVLGFAE